MIPWEVNLDSFSLKVKSHPLKYNYIAKADIKPFADEAGVCPVPQHHSPVYGPLHNPGELTLLHYPDHGHDPGGVC